MFDLLCSLQTSYESIFTKIDRETLFQVEIVDYLLKELKLGDLFTEDEVQKCIGTVRINAIRSTEYHDRGR